MLISNLNSYFKGWYASYPLMLVIVVSVTLVDDGDKGEYGAL